MIELAGWVVAAEDHQGYPFATMDKAAAQILVFGGDGRHRGAAQGLFGSAVGDHPGLHPPHRDWRSGREAPRTPGVAVAGDNRVTHGCINVPPEFYERVIRPTIKRGRVVYILPDEVPMAEAFPEFVQKSRDCEAQRLKARRGSAALSLSGRPRRPCVLGNALVRALPADGSFAPSPLRTRLALAQLAPYESALRRTFPSSPCPMGYA